MYNLLFLTCTTLNIYIYIFSKHVGILTQVRDAEYRVSIESRQKNSRDSSLTEQALLNIVEKQNYTLWSQLYQYTDKYWKAKNGYDHIIVMPAPVTNFRHETSRRGFFHYMIHLTAPIYICLEYSLSFVREYPVCASSKNIVMPYPSTDPDLFSEKLFQKPINRTALLYYWGGT